MLIRLLPSQFRELLISVYKLATLQWIRLQLAVYYLKHLLLNLLNLVWLRILGNSNFLNIYYKRSDNIWNDGFLFDFLQKKTIDALIRQYVIFTGFLFSERLVFDYIIRVYNDILIWNLQNKNLINISNTSTMLNITIFTLYTLLVALVLIISVLV